MIHKRTANSQYREYSCIQSLCSQIFIIKNNHSRKHSASHISVWSWSLGDYPNKPMIVRDEVIY